MHEYVTGGGLAGGPLPDSWAAEGGAMRRALAGDFAALPGVRVVMTLDDRLPAEPGPWDVVRVGPGREREVFARLAAEASATALIAPETGGLLADRARIIEAVGGRSLGPTAAAIELAGDKFAMGLHWRAAGVPTPPCRRVVPARGLPRDASYPAVLKPADGAGSVETFFIPGPDDLPAESLGMASAVLQPFVPGIPLSASFLVDSGGGIELVGVARQCFEREGRAFHYRGGVVPFGRAVPIEAAWKAVRSVPGLKGWIGVDFLRDEASGSVSILEINPRLTTSYVGFRALLPAGTLAGAWLDGADDGMAGRVQACTPLTFSADGVILAGG